MDLPQIFGTALGESIRTTLQQYTVISRIVCGAVAGSVAKTVIAPAERVKMHFQISQDKFSLNAAIKRGLYMIKNEGKCMI